MGVTDLFVFAAICCFWSSWTEAARAETISGALAAAYLSYPDLAQQRAATRAADEGVARAQSGYRPQVAGSSSFGYSQKDVRHGTLLDDRTAEATPSSAAITVRQPLFDANRTTTRVERAESDVFRSREDTREKEQATLQGAATAYMDVLRDIALLDLRKYDIEVLIVRLREARARFRAQEVTQTDVAEVAASLAAARSAYFTAQGRLYTSTATYTRIVGRAPRRLEAARPLDALLPRDVTVAVAAAFAEHPRIHAALHRMDEAALDVRLAESDLYPTLDALGRAARENEDRGTPTRNFTDAGVRGELRVPIYTGGAAYATIRMAKEKLAQARDGVDIARDLVRAKVEGAWGVLAASKARIQSAEAAVKASETAYVGVREEAKLGQRTTLNILEALQTLLQARVSLVTAQRDRVVATYDLVAAMGCLSATRLGLRVAPDDPTLHYNLVKDKWIGLRTPDGR